MFNSKLFVLFSSVVMSIISLACIKTEGTSDAASAYGINKDDYVAVGETASSEVSVTQNLASPRLDMQRPTTESVDNERARLLREVAELRAQQRSRATEPDLSVGARRTEESPPVRSAPPPLQGFPLPGIAGGPSLGMGAIMPGGGIRVIELRPAIVRPVFWVNVINHTRPNQYIGIEVTNGNVQLVPCSGRMGSWMSVIDVHTRQPIWILPPGSDACLTRPIDNCPSTDDGECNTKIRVVRYTFSAPYAMRGPAREEMLPWSSANPGNNLNVTH